MSSPRPAARPDPRTTRRTLALITLVAVAPFVASYLAYYVFPRGSYVNYGTLLAVPAADVQGRTTSGEPFTLASLRGKWALVTAAPGACDATCRQALYATRQARTMQGRELDRVVRVWIVTDGVAPPAGLLAEHPGLLVVSAARSDVLAAWPGRQRRAVPAGSARQPRHALPARSGHCRPGQGSRAGIARVLDRIGQPIRAMLESTAFRSRFRRAGWRPRRVPPGLPP
jgi:hypothetical protein